MVGTSDSLSCDLQAAAAAFGLGHHHLKSILKCKHYALFSSFPTIAFRRSSLKDNTVFSNYHLDVRAVISPTSVFHSPFSALSCRKSSMESVSSLALSQAKDLSNRTARCLLRTLAILHSPFSMQPGQSFYPHKRYCSLSLILSSRCFPPATELTLDSEIPLSRLYSSTPSSPALDLGLKLLTDPDRQTAA